MLEKITPEKRISAGIALAVCATLSLCACTAQAAYFDDESSPENSFSAATLDFRLERKTNFGLLDQTNSITSEIELDKLGSLDFEYSAGAADFSGSLCDFLDLTAKTGEEIKYSGRLTEFSSSSNLFPENNPWNFLIKLSADVTSNLDNSECRFSLKYSSRQIGSTGNGFSDEETIGNVIFFHIAEPSLLTPLDDAKINGKYVKQCWTPLDGATKYIYQSCHNDPDADGFCDERWHQEYSAGSQEFAQACKWASNITDTQYWWRVKAVTALGETDWPESWKITIDNSRKNKVVINEFLPNPIGNDDALMPQGEWVELYNNTGTDADLNNWTLRDAYDSHILHILSENTDTGGTIVRSGGWLVVYRNGDSDFSLNNSGDTVRLFNGSALIDSYAYTEEKNEGYSFARIPDGSENWVDPIPTPGKPNFVGDENVVFSTPSTPDYLPEEQPIIQEETSDTPEAQEQFLDPYVTTLIATQPETDTSETTEPLEEPKNQDPEITEPIEQETIIKPEQSLEIPEVQQVEAPESTNETETTETTEIQIDQENNHENTV